MIEPRGTSPRLQRILEQYLTTRIQAFEREERSRAEQELKTAADAAVRTEVGRMITRLILLAGYSLLLGELSTPQLLATLVNPAELGRLVQLAATRLDALIRLVPDALRSSVIGGAGALVALSFNSVSFQARFEVGGTLLVGVVVMSILGFASAASTGLIGTLAFLVGILGSLYIVLEFFQVLRQLDIGAGPVGVLHADSSVFSRIAGRLLEDSRVDAVRSVGRALRPERSRVATLAFLAVPPVALAAMLAVTIADQGGPPGPVLYWVFWSGLMALLAWSLWACAATPSRVRIPLWSMVGWSTFVILLVYFTPVSAIFALAMVTTLFLCVQVVVLGWSGAFRRLWRSQDI